MYIVYLLKRLLEERIIIVSLLIHLRSLGRYVVRISNRWRVGATISMVLLLSGTSNAKVFMMLKN